MADEKDPKDQDPGNKDPKDDKNNKNDKGGDANDDDLDANDLASAKSLFKALKDPETATEIIEAMARRAGLLDKKGEPKDSKKDTEKKLEGKAHKLFKNKLGKDYEKFSDTIGPLLDEAIQEYLEEHFTKAENKNNQDTWENSVDSFLEDKEIPKKVQRKMQELMEEMPPNLKSKTFKPERYLNRIWENALSDLDMEKPQKKETRRNRDNDPDEFVVRKRPENLSTDDAIEAALKGIRYT